VSTKSLPRAPLTDIGSEGEQARDPGTDGAALRVYVEPEPLNIGPPVGQVRDTRGIHDSDKVELDAPGFEMTPTPTSLAPENGPDDADETSAASARSAVSRPSNPAARPTFTLRWLRSQTTTSVAPRVAASAKRKARTVDAVDIGQILPHPQAALSRFPPLSARLQRAATVMQDVR
jgi:hypothetical protein